MSKIILALVWFFSTVVLACSAILFYNFYFFDLRGVNRALALAREQKSPSEEFSPAQLAAAAASEASFSAQPGTRDARARLVANFIERNDANKTSPLQPYDEWGKIFVDIADEYGLDFRLLPAIARKESTFCKSNIAQTYFNCYGYGVPASGITEAGKFTSFEEGTRVVARSLKKSYLDQGLTDPMAIMEKYCPPCFQGDGTWARNLNQWLAEMRYDDKTSSADRATNTDLLEFVPND